MASPLFGIGTGVAGGAATGATFGPIGAGVGAGVGGLIGGLQSLLESQERARQREKARKLAKVMAMRNRAAALGGDTSYLDAKLAGRNIDEQFAEPAPNYAGLLQQVAGAAGTLRQNARAEQAEQMLRDRLEDQQEAAWRSQFSNGGRMRGALPF